MMKKIPILIIGGGPVGLSMALSLARQNVSSLIVEKHSGRAPHPRARGVSMRTMELLSQWGDINELLKYEFPREAIRFIWAESLQGNEVTRIEFKSDRYTHGLIGASFITQDCVEEYLRHTLQKHPEAEIQYSKEMISFEENDNGVTVKLLDRVSNKEELIQTQYLIAADGAHSTIRNQLEIEMDGPDNLGRSCSVYAEFDVSPWTKDRTSLGFFFTDPALLGRSLLTAYGKNRWIVAMHIKPDDTKENFSDEYCINEIRRILDIPDLNIKIINKSFWTMAAQVAKQYRKGRVFLVGDAAHRLPPTGGLGMNTGIADAHNLAWKLASVVKHQVSDTLLDTYYEERAPIAKQNIAWSTENAKRYFDIVKAIQAGDQDTLKLKLREQQKHLNYEGLDLGFIYHSNAVLSENDEVISLLPDQYKPTTLPGSRAPYVKLMKDGKAISILDLFEKEYVLLVGADGDAWQATANNLASMLPLKCYRVAKDGDLIDPENNWHALYEITTSGALLVRPDGHVAWRSKVMVADLKDILTKVLIKVNGGDLL